MEDLQREGATIEKYNADLNHLLEPNIFGSIDGQAVHIFVRASRYPNQSVLENNIAYTAKIMAQKRNAVAYFAAVGLMPAEDQNDYYFVNYRGCQLIE